MTSRFGKSLPGAPLDVVPGSLVGAHAAHDDHVEGRVGLAVPPAVEAMALRLPARCGQRGGTAQHRGARLGARSAGILAGGDHQLARAGDAHAFEREQIGSELLDERSDVTLERGDLLVEGQDPAGEGPQREPGGNRRVPVSRGIRPPGRTGAQAAHAGEVADPVADPVAHLGRRGDDGVVELLQGGVAGLDRGLASCAQHPQGLHRAAAALGDLDPASRASRLGGRNRIERVVLPPGSSRGRVRTGHLEHGHSGQRQVPGNAGAVAAGGLDSHAQELAVGPEPGKHRPVSGSCRGERFGAEHRAFDRQNGGGVQILVGVDAPDDPGVPSWRTRHVGPLCP